MVTGSIARLLRFTQYRAMLIIPLLSDRSPAAIEAAYRGWCFEMQRAHERMPGWWWDAGQRRARFALAAGLVARMPADIEADMARAHAAIAAIRADLSDHWRIRRRWQRDGDARMASLVAGYLRERIALLRRHRARLVGLREERGQALADVSWSPRTT
jgi:hypothetical protein